MDARAAGYSGRDGRGLPHSGSWVGVKRLPSVITLSIPSLIICMNRKFHGNTDCSKVLYLYHLRSSRDGDADSTQSAGKKRQRRETEGRKEGKMGDDVDRWADDGVRNSSASATNAKERIGGGEVGRVKDIS